MFDYQRIIDRHYPEGSPLRDIYLRHCRQVADKALSIARAKALTLPPGEIEAAAMLHDIGIFLCDAPSICCHGSEHYLRHGMLGADLLRAEGAPEELARAPHRLGHLPRGNHLRHAPPAGRPLLHARDHPRETDMLRRQILLQIGRHGRKTIAPGDGRHGQIRAGAIRQIQGASPPAGHLNKVNKL